MLRFDCDLAMLCIGRAERVWCQHNLHVHQRALEGISMHSLCWRRTSSSPTHSQHYKITIKWLLNRYAIQQKYTVTQANWDHTKIASKFASVSTALVFTDIASTIFYFGLFCQPKVSHNFTKQKHSAFNFAQNFNFHSQFKVVVSLAWSSLESLDPLLRAFVLLLIYMRKQEVFLRLSFHSNRIIQCYFSLQLFYSVKFLSLKNSKKNIVSFPQC